MFYENENFSLKKLSEQDFYDAIKNFSISHEKCSFSLNPPPPPLTPHPPLKKNYSNENTKLKCRGGW